MVELKMQFPDSFFEEEERCGFTVTRERKELWAVELDLLNEFDRVCNAHDLKYFADGGTLLGAMRHKGFIPWDDDIDIVMLRRDYNKLCRVASEEFKEPYFFQTERTDPGSMRCHAQLRNSMTTGILTTEFDLHLAFNQGIFIDIFPLDNIPDDDDKLRKFISAIKYKRLLAVAYARVSSRYRECPASLREYALRVLHAMIGKKSRNPFYERFDKYIQTYDQLPAGRVAKLFFPEFKERHIWNRSWLEGLSYVQFEMLKIPVCIGSEEYLTMFYHDWKTPKNIRSAHGNLFADVETPYKEYINNRSLKISSVSEGKKW